MSKRPYTFWNDPGLWLVVVLPTVLFIVAEALVLPGSPPALTAFKGKAPVSCARSAPKNKEPATCTSDDGVAAGMTLDGRPGLKVAPGAVFDPGTGRFGLGF